MFKPFFFEFEFLKCIFFILSLSHAAAAPNSYFAEIPNGISNMCLLFYAFGSNSAHFFPFLSEAIYSAYTPLPLFNENQQQNLRSRSMPKLFETSSSYKTNCFRPMTRTFMDKMLETCECSYICFTCVHICAGFMFCVWNMNIMWYNISRLWHGLRKYICPI